MEGHRAGLEMTLDNDTLILKALLEGASEFVSGNALAKELGVTRVAVWARMEKMREHGFEFEAIPHRGYRLATEPKSLNASLIRAYLACLEPSAKILFFPELDSTNSEAERQLAAGRQTPFVILAAEQNQGRGRMGRGWHSPDKEGNCYISFIFRPNLSPQRMQSFTLWMGLNMCELLNDFCKTSVKLKWPNDLILSNRKVGGMLTEARVDADQTRDLVFGLGINVNGRCKNWPRKLARSAISLSTARGEPLPANELAARVITTGLHASKRFFAEACEQEMLALWERYDCLKGRKVMVETENDTATGTVAGIDKSGSLLLRTGSGKVIALNSGEVTLGSGQVLAKSRK